MVTNFGLSHLAVSIKNIVDKVVLNQEVELVDFLLSKAEGNVYTLQFSVPEGLAEINHIQVLDTEGNAISKNNTFIPIATDANIEYNIAFENFENVRMST